MTVALWLSTDVGVSVLFPLLLFSPVTDIKCMLIPDSRDGPIISLLRKCPSGSAEPSSPLLAFTPSLADPDLLHKFSAGEEESPAQPSVLLTNYKTLLGAGLC